MLSFTTWKLSLKIKQQSNSLFLIYICTLFFKCLHFSTCPLLRRTFEILYLCEREFNYFNNKKVFSVIFLSEDLWFYTSEDDKHSRMSPCLINVLFEIIIKL